MGLHTMYTWYNREHGAGRIVDSDGTHAVGTTSQFFKSALQKWIAP
jgi:hypothetical protein